MMSNKGTKTVSIEKPVLEVSSHEVPLELCADPDITSGQLAALQENDIEVIKGRARISGATTHFTQLNTPGGSEKPRLVISNGYWAPDSAYKQLAVELAIAGNDVVYVKPSRVQNPIEACRPQHLKDVLLIQAQGLWAVMKVVGEDQYDLYGHSMGFVVASSVAEAKAERVQTLTSAGGAGTAGHGHVVPMLYRTGRLLQKDVYGGRNELRSHCPPRMLGESLLRAAISPVRTAREGITVAQADVRGRLERLQQDTDIKLGALVFGNDIYFPPKRVLSATGDLFDDLQVISGASHIYPQDHPFEHGQDVTKMTDRLHAVSNLRLIN